MYSWYEKHNYLWLHNYKFRLLIDIRTEFDYDFLIILYITYRSNLNL